MLNRRSGIDVGEPEERAVVVGKADPRSKIIMALWTYQVCMSRLGGDALRRLPCGPCGKDRLHSVWADGENYLCYHCVIIGRHPVTRAIQDPPMVPTKTRRCRTCDEVTGHLAWAVAVGSSCLPCLYRRRDVVTTYVAVAGPLPDEQPKRRSAIDIIADLIR